MNRRIGLATKAVAEWFPRKESGWAVALFDSGSAIGGAVAPLLVYEIYKHTGELAALLSGNRHPWTALDSAVSMALSQSGGASAPHHHAERELILAGRGDTSHTGQLLPLPHTASHSADMGHRDFRKR